PAGSNGAREQSVELPAARACLQGCLVRPPHLSQDLGFTQNLGFEPGRDLIEVSNAGAAVPSSRRCSRLHAPRAGKLDQPGFEVVAAGPVNLESVAGRENGGATASVPLLIQPRGCLGRRENQLFSHFQWSRTMAHPDATKNVQGRGWHLAPSVGESRAGVQHGGSLSGQAGCHW